MELTVLTLLKVHSSPNGWQHGERPFWKTLGRQYLDAWLANVERFVPNPKRVVVMTDAPLYGAPRWVSTVTVDRHVDAPGFWAKLNMFRESVSEGRCLYIDLDNVIAGDLSELCALEADPIIMLDDRRVPGLSNGSMMLFDAERCRGLWSTYESRPRQIERDFIGPRGEDYSHAYDQAYIAEWMDESGFIVPFFQELLPAGYILNAVSELPQTEDWRSARVIFGSGVGEGKPHTATHPAFSIGR